MKVLKIVLTAALTVTMLFSTVLAVESPEKGDGPNVISATDATGDVTNYIVTTRLGSSSPYGQINAYLDSARADIAAASEKPANLKGSDGQTLEAAFQEKLGDGYSAADLKFAEVFDASKVMDGEVVKPEGSITITFEYSAANGPFFVLHQDAAGVWRIVNASVSGGTVTVTTGSLSPFAFVSAVQAKAPIKDGKTPSPQTGEYVTRYVLVAAAALMVAGFVCVKRAKKSSVK
ncbi:MAG: hypothetical protein J6040_09955 [Clostridiales bacterium]|nr:hypothetical protein [Clostridiales bacterium]MBP5492719.1 hypothetical protein [Clostridiales bacterium]